MRYGFEAFMKGQNATLSKAWGNDHSDDLGRSLQRHWRSWIGMEKCSKILLSNCPSWKCLGRNSDFKMWSGYGNSIQFSFHLYLFGAKNRFPSFLEVYLTTYINYCIWKIYPQWIIFTVYLLVILVNKIFFIAIFTI